MSQKKPIEELLKAWKEFVRPEPGDRFLHYKGGQYEIVATGFLENTEVPCVIYLSLKNNTVWVRTAKDFFEVIEHDGHKVPRFKKKN